MFIRRIILNDYRIYYGKHELEFSPESGKNIFLISGENGFGKTSFLTALVWCLYGKSIIHVDEVYRQEVHERGGYKKYATSNLNWRVAAQCAYSPEDRALGSYSVGIVLSDVSIPAISCREVQITRTYDIRSSGDDCVEILLDGQKNELTNEVGPHIFINDFILPKEVARLFFFDAEKIASLSEASSFEVRRELSRAYAEVLGIKKYELLRNNLQELRIRLRRSLATEEEQRKFQNLEQNIEKIASLIAKKKEKIAQFHEEKDAQKRQSEDYQEQLIREGHSLTVSDLLALKKERDGLSEKATRKRLEMKDLLELAPFAVSGDRLKEAIHQLRKESAYSRNKLPSDLLKDRVKNIRGNFRKTSSNCK